MPSLSQIHRPKTFAEITGQKHVTETLRREVATGILGHAFLFSGPRGVGKTTTARVFAKALNCSSPHDGEPCGACVPCEAANHGRLIDLIELDAATHTGVDTVREAIIEHARFSPMIGKRKVYVLDEAHMLSPSSWNALLKTLEEPPPYAFFILATTEWHKVPATIVSRCQRFAFRRVDDELLAARVCDLATREGWRADDDVVKLIVSRADGCLRDAETLLGQIGSLGNQHLTMETAGLVIPPSHLPRACELMRTWAEGDISAAFAALRRFVDEGAALVPFMDDLVEVIRRLLVTQADAEISTRWEKGSEEERALAPLVSRFSAKELHDLALMIFERRRDAKQGVDPLFALQLASAAGVGSREKETRSWKLEAGSRQQENKESIEQQNKKTTDQEIKKPTERASVSSAPSVSESAAPRSMIHATNITLPNVLAKWPAIIRAVDEQNHALPFILKTSRPCGVEGKTIIIKFQYAFHQDKLCKDIKNRRVVEQCARELLGVEDLQISGVVGEDVAKQDEASKDIVGQLLQTFGGTVIDG